MILMSTLTSMLTVIIAKEAVIQGHFYHSMNKLLGLNVNIQFALVMFNDRQLES